MSALTPRAILDAAAADLLAREQKRDGKLGRGERYCFHVDHVAAASSVPHLLELALSDCQRGITSCKRVTRAIYGDPDALAAALVLARRPS